MIDPLGKDRELDSLEGEVHASEDHGHREKDPLEQEKRRLSDHTLEVVTAAGTVIVAVAAVIALLMR